MKTQRGYKNIQYYRNLLEDDQLKFFHFDGEAHRIFTPDLESGTSRQYLGYTIQNNEGHEMTARVGIAEKLFADIFVKTFEIFELEDTEKYVMQSPTMRLVGNSQNRIEWLLDVGNLDVQFSSWWIEYNTERIP